MPLELAQPQPVLGATQPARAECQPILLGYATKVRKCSPLLAQNLTVDIDTIPHGLLNPQLQHLRDFWMLGLPCALALLSHALSVLMAKAAFVLHPVGDFGLLEAQIGVLGGEMLRCLRLVAPIGMVPVKDFNPLLECRILRMREDRLDSFLLAWCLARWDDRLMVRPLKRSVCGAMEAF
jgi:hypothetical protein